MCPSDAKKKITQSLVRYTGVINRKSGVGDTPRRTKITASGQLESGLPPKAAKKLRKKRGQTPIAKTHPGHSACGTSLRGTRTATHTTRGDHRPRLKTFSGVSKQLPGLLTPFAPSVSTCRPKNARVQCANFSHLYALDR